MLREIEKAGSSQPMNGQRQSGQLIEGRGKGGEISGQL